mgnify:CR=1 FL=1
MSLELDVYDRAIKARAKVYETYNKALVKGRQVPSDKNDRALAVAFKACAKADDDLKAVCLRGATLTASLLRKAGARK